MPFPQVEHRQVHWELLRAYVEQGDEAAFARLVEAYVGMVFSSAMRQTRNRDLAQEVTHVVFIILARKAKSLRADVVLSAWLHKTTRFTALNVLKVQARRTRHERKAAEMNSESARVHSSWNRLSPMLDEAIARLGERDRCAIILRYFDRKTPAEVGREMGISEDAAAMRISRAVARLRLYFRDRRVDLDAETMGVVIMANAISTVPAELTGTVTAGISAATQAGAASASGAGAVGAGISAMQKVADEVIRAMFIAQARAAALVAAMVLAAVLLLGLFTNELIVPLFHRHGSGPADDRAMYFESETMRQVRSQLMDRRDLLAMAGSLPKRSQRG